MIHVDYTWDLYPNGMTLDEELNTDRLGWKHGDYFRFENHNGKQKLVKVDPLVKFVREGEQHVQNKME